MNAMHPAAAKGGGEISNFNGEQNLTPLAGHGPLGQQYELRHDENGKPLMIVGGHVVTHPDFLNTLPWIQRRRLTYEEFCARAMEKGLQAPTVEAWANTFVLSLEEVREQIAWEELAYTRAVGDMSALDGHIVIAKFGNKPRVVWRRRDGLLGFMSHDEFKTAYGHLRLSVTDADGETKSVPMVNVWLRGRRTPRYEAAEFLPGRLSHDVPWGVYNIWAGHPEGLPRERDLRPHVVGDIIPDDDEHDGEEAPEECSLFLDHLYYNACDENDEYYWWLLGWVADMLNRRGHCEVAITMTGPPGSGKGTIGEFFGSLVKPHYLQVNNKDKVTGKFNRHLMEVELLFADEVDFASSAEATKTLRNVISEPDIQIEAKGVDAFTAPKWFRVMIASNDEHVIGALGQERRHVVLNVDAGDRNRDGAYFGVMREQWYQQGGRVAFFRWLTGRWWRERLRSGEWDMRKFPLTEALQKQKDLSLPPPLLVVHNMLLHGEVPCDFASNSGAGTVFVPTQLLADARRIGDKDVTALGNALRLLAGEGAKSVRVYLGEGRDKRQHRGFWLPPLELCRQRWVRHLGRPVAWPADVDSWAVEARPSPGESDVMPF